MPPGEFARCSYSHVDLTEPLPGVLLFRMYATAARSQYCPDGSTGLNDSLPGWRYSDAKCSLADGKHDLAARAALIHLSQSLDHLIQRIGAVNHRPQLSLRDELLQPIHVRHIERLPPQRQA